MMLREQMERFPWEHKPAKDAHGKDRWSMTGKLGEQQDDALLATLMANTWGRAIQANPRHRRVLQRIGNGIPARGVVDEVSKVVMQSFQTVKNTSLPKTLQAKLAALQHEYDIWGRDPKTGRSIKRLRGDPNTKVDMTLGPERGTTKRVRVERPVAF